MLDNLNKKIYISPKSPTRENNPIPNGQRITTKFGDNVVYIIKIGNRKDVYEE